MYTHKFKMKLEGYTIEGELAFNGDGKPSWKTDEEIELTIEVTKYLQRLLECVTRLHNRVANIEKIKITEK